MSSADLNQPQKFMMADIVTKNSKTGITSNKRLLVIKKGHLYYYSNVPKNFKNDIKFLQSYHELPKCSIEILNIKKINGFENGSNYFSIEFEARHMMEIEDIRKTMTLQQFNFAPKNKKETITWQFTCDNQFIKQKWVNSLQTLHAHYKKQKINIQKFFDNINKKQEEKEAPAIRSSMMVPWREDQMKKSSSNESIRKSQINNVSARSPSNTKKDIRSDKGLVVDKQINKVSIGLPESEDDLVMGFMKIEKTQSAYESPASLRDEQKQQKAEIEVLKHQKSLKGLQKNESVKKIIQQNPSLLKPTPNIQKIDNSESIRQKHETITLDGVQQALPSVKQQQVEIDQKEEVESIRMSTDKQVSVKNNPTNISPTNVGLQQRAPKLESKPHKISNDYRFKVNRMPSLEQKISSISKVSSIQYNVNANTTLYELYYFACFRQYLFDKRIEAQKKINTIIGSFTDKAVKSFIQFIDLKGQAPSRAGRYNQQKLSQSLSMLDIGYCRYKIGYVNTQNIIINEKQKVFYNEKSIKQLKQQMKIYGKILSAIVQAIKCQDQSRSNNFDDTFQLALSSLSLSQSRPINKQSIQSDTVESKSSNWKASLCRLRVPLCTYIQYKGICTLVYDQSHKNKEIEITDKDRLGMFKQLLRHLGYNSNCFDFKNVATSVGELTLVYINNLSGIELKSKIPKHHNVSFESPMNLEFLRKAKREGASTSTESLLRYIKSISAMKDTSKFTCPRQQIIVTLQYCYMCKYLRKFYRAAQAQLDELSFINLVLQGDNKIHKLFASSGFESEPKLPNVGVQGLFLEFLNYYLGINIQVNSQLFTKFANLSPIAHSSREVSNQREHKLVKAVKILPRVIGYSLEGFQLYESFSRVDQYICNRSKQLVEKVLDYKQSSFYDNTYQLSSYPWPSSAECLYSLAELNFTQNDYITSIAKCKEYLFTVSPSDDESESQWRSPTPSCCIPTYFLMIKCYSKFSRQKMNQSLKQLINATTFCYGQNSSMIITVFSFAAHVFFSIGQYTQAQNFLSSAIRMAEKVYKNYRKSKLIDLNLDLSRILLHQNKLSQANAYYKKAKIYKLPEYAHQQDIGFLLYDLEASLKAPKSIIAEQNAMETLFEAEKRFKGNSTINQDILKQYYSLVYQVGLKYNKNLVCGNVIAGLWGLDFNSKLMAIENAFKIARKRLDNTNNQYLGLLDNWSLSKEKSILKIQQNLKNYPSLMDMLIEVFLEKDNQLLPAFLKVLPQEIIKATP